MFFKMISLFDQQSLPWNNNRFNNQTNNGPFNENEYAKLIKIEWKLSNREVNCKPHVLVVYINVGNNVYLYVIHNFCIVSTEYLHLMVSYEIPILRCSPPGSIINSLMTAYVKLFIICWCNSTVHDTGNWACTC